MRKLFFAALLLPAVLILILGWSNNSEKNKKVLIHIVTDIKKDDGPPCVAVDVALTNIQLGNEVTVLFDANAAWNLKKSEDGKNDYDRYEVPADLKKLVNEQLNVKELSALKNFGEFLEMLHKKGAKIAVNGTWNVLTSVEKEVKGKTKMPDYVDPLNLKEMVQEINRSGTYYSY
jgi:predicted peroxiredoxin